MDNRNPTYGRFYRGFRGNIGVDTGGMVMVTMHGSLVGGETKVVGIVGVKEISGTGTIEQETGLTLVENRPLIQHISLR
jgi:hypothetical protein